MTLPVNIGDIRQVNAGLPGGEDGLRQQAVYNQQINDLIKQVEQRASIGGQLAGRKFAAQRSLAQSQGLNLPQASQVLMDRHNYAHNLKDIKAQNLAFGEHEPFFGNMDQVTQMTGKDIMNTYDEMTPYQQQLAMSGAKVARGPLAPFNQGFASNLLLIRQARLRQTSMYAFV